MVDNKKFAANTTILIVFVAFISISLVGGLILEFSGLDAVSEEIIFSVLIQVVCLGIIPLTLFNLLQKKGGRNSRKKGENFPAYIDLSTPQNGGIDSRKKTESFPEYLSLSAPKGGVMRRLLWITVCAMAISYIISFLTQIVLEFLPSGTPIAEEASSAEVMSFGSLLLGLVLGCVFPAVFEELTFRGILLGAYKDSPKIGVFLSATMFALMHMNIDQTFYTFFLGIVLAVLTLKSRSIFPAMIVHFLNNAASYISAYFLSQLLALPAEETEQAVEAGEAVGGPIVEIMAMIIVVGIVLTIFGVALYGLISGIRKINKDNPIDWSEKSEKVTSVKTRLATAAAIFIGIDMTALTIILRMM